MTISKAAVIIGTSHQNVKKVLLLKQQGFLDMTKHPADGRVTMLSLTEHCVNYFAVRAGMEANFFGEVFRGFDEDTLAGLYNGLCLLEKNIETMENYDRNGGVDDLDYNRFADACWYLGLSCGARWNALEAISVRGENFNGGIN